jgi:UDPglucose--hexose-1-phosphate uridylyltransferase
VHPADISSCTGVRSGVVEADPTVADRREPRNLASGVRITRGRRERAVNELRHDPTLGTAVHVVGTRQQRPNLPSTGCPFCVGGREAPEWYDVRWFTNRWPAMDGDRCEVVLYTPDHEASFWSLGVAGARRVVDVWADRNRVLGERDDVDYVLIFENRGPEVGATIAHPHGQIYAYDHVPSRQRRRLDARRRPERAAGDRLVVEQDGWMAYVPFAPAYPLALEIAPRAHLRDLPSVSGPDRDALVTMLVDVLTRLDRLYERPLPYMLWLNQRPSIDGADDEAWFGIEIVSPWRSAGVSRFIAAAEVASDEFFNLVVPDDIARQLRALG